MTLPSVLYHGTSERHVAAIRADGICPRTRTGNSNWDRTYASMPDRVYLTTAYALHFAKCAAEDGGRMALVEVDARGLTESRLCPDEDFVAQGLLHAKKFKRMADAQRAAIRDEKDWRRVWPDCLKSMGVVAYRGAIAAARVRRVVLVDPEKQVRQLMFVDPTINQLNYAIKGQYYRDMTAWYFGDTETFPEEAETEKLISSVFPEGPWAFLKDKLEHLKGLSADRGGIEAVDVGSAASCRVDRRVV